MTIKALIFIFFHYMVSNSGLELHNANNAAPSVNKVYAIGGYAHSKVVNTVEVYSPHTDRWTQAPPMPTPRCELVCITANGRIYAIGGDNGTDVLNTNEAFDPSTNTWIPRKSMPTPRESPAAAQIDGIIYVMGGGSTSSGAGSYYNKNEAYNPLSDTWTLKAPMPTPREATATTDGSNIYVIGGFNYTYNGWGIYSYLNKNEVYSPATNTWKIETPLPSRRHYVAVGYVKGKVYAIGGNNNSGPLALNEAFDLNTKQWTSLAPLPTPRSGAASVTINNRLYVIGGFDGVSEVGTNQVYDPATNTWTTKAPMPTPRRYFGLAVK
jgi:N-acetylneuraminic acid mutarotase